jgi:hypothetical protein
MIPTLVRATGKAAWLPAALAIAVLAGATAWGEGFSASAAPSLELGTHVNRTGLSGRLEDSGTLGPVLAGVDGFATAEYDASYLGIEGPSPVGNFGIGTEAGFGPHASAFSPWGGTQIPRAHEIRFEWLAFLDTWGTSQTNGLISYVYRTDDCSIGLVFEDDIFGLRFRDEYRTAALELGSRFRILAEPVSLFLGTKMWTGSTDGNGRLYWGETYDMSHHVGANRSAGILYLGAGIRIFRVSAGWDSERIRDVFQNGFHRIIDDGRVPLIPGRRDRPYFEFAVNSNDNLY